jgi:hypothetical protein
MHRINDFGGEAVILILLGFLKFKRFPDEGQSSYRGGDTFLVHLAHAEGPRV